ncbi:unnamed protein product [Calypogeia fissa]
MGVYIDVPFLTNFLCAIAPVYLSILVGVASSVAKFLTPECMPAFNAYLKYVGIPTLLFRRLAENSPADIDLRLLRADALTKLISFVLLLLWWRFFSKLGRRESLEWVITFFMLSTLPNTVLVGDSILKPMFGELAESQTTTIIFAQCLYWYNFVILLMEIREVMLEDEANANPGSNKGDQRVGNQDPNFFKPKSLHRDIIAAIDGNLYEGSSEKISLFSSVPQMLATGKDYSPGSTNNIANNPQAEIDHLPENLKPGARTENYGAPGDKQQPMQPSSLMALTSNHRHEQQIKGPVTDVLIFEKCNTDHSPRSKMDADSPAIVKAGEEKATPELVSSIDIHGVAVFARRVLNKVLRMPITYGTSLGFIYSLFAFHYQWEMPTFMKVTLAMCADWTMGSSFLLLDEVLETTCSLSLGITVVKNIVEGKGIIPCGYKVLFAGFAVRFLAAPAIMFASAGAVSIHGASWIYAIVQVIVPQGSMTFSLARFYDCKVNVMGTAVYAQIVVFIPFILAYYALLEAL